MKKIISFDFDETLYFEDKDQKQNKKLIELIKKYYRKGFETIIVTARSKYYDKAISKISVIDFVKLHKIPITKIYFTNGKLKGPILKKIGSKLHFDNDLEEIESCKKSNIKVIKI
tara:strand:+ start:760 stop:1104 length:345 start_codon:yes stop_codon:yes gene_type:complete